MITFYRRDYKELWIRIVSNEVLGLLDSSFIQDYYGVDGQVTLRNLDTGEGYVVLMSEAVEETPTIQHDILVGFHSLDSLPDGNYEIQGRVKDKAGNYSIVGDFHDTTAVINRHPYDFEIASGTGQDVELGEAFIVGEYTFYIGYKRPQNIVGLHFNPNLNDNSQLFLLFNLPQISAPVNLDSGDINVVLSVDESIVIALPLRHETVITLPLKDV